jgi:hypothetical protein
LVICQKEVEKILVLFDFYWFRGFGNLKFELQLLEELKKLRVFEWESVGKIRRELNLVRITDILR